MGWNTLLPNQCISFNNLQDACNTGLFFSSQPIPVSTEQITKQDFESLKSPENEYLVNIPEVVKPPNSVTKPRSILALIPKPAFI